MQLQNTLLFCLLTLIFISCKKENGLPIANAGADRTLNYPVSSIALDGSASSAPGGTLTRYEWRLLSGPPYSSFSSNLTAKTLVTHDPILKSLAAGTYSFELKVTDNEGQHAVDSVKVNVSLKGQEFVFNDLAWEVFTDFDGHTHVIIPTPPLPEFFHRASIYNLDPNPSGLEVYLKEENTSAWLPVRQAGQSGGENFYYISDEHLIVENEPKNMPPNTALVGKKVSIKLKFL